MINSSVLFYINLVCFECCQCTFRKSLCVHFYYWYCIYLISVTDVMLLLINLPLKGKKQIQKSCIKDYNLSFEKILLINLHSPGVRVEVIPNPLTIFFPSSLARCSNTIKSLSHRSTLVVTPKWKQPFCVCIASVSPSMQSAELKQCRHGKGIA